MTRDDALRLLSLPADAPADQIRTTVAQRLEEARSRVESAPTDALRAKYASTVAELEAAGRVLLEVASPAVPASLSHTMAEDLPAAVPSFTVGDADYGAAAGARLSIEQGQVLAGRYEIRERIGVGGMGAVFRAFDRNRDSEIAIKVMLPSLIGRGKAKERFLSEARLSSELSHPGIVNVFDVQNEGELFFLTMELLEGRTLREEMAEYAERHEPYPIERAVEVAKDVCTALDYAHRTTVHRDVKPENVFVCSDGHVKLMDFGIARVLSTSQLTMTGAAMGTAYYMAPEQLKGAKEVDGRADQYSVGVMLYEMLTGEVPAGMAQPVEEIRRGVPKSLSVAIRRALSPDPGKRYESAADLGAALSAGGRPAGVRMGTPRWALVGVAVLVLGGVLFGLRAPIAEAVARVTYDEAAVQSAQSRYEALLADWEALAEDRPAALDGLELPSAAVGAAEEAGRAYDQAVAIEAWERAHDELAKQISVGRDAKAALDAKDEATKAAVARSERERLEKNQEALARAGELLAAAKTRRTRWNDKLEEIGSWYDDRVRDIKDRERIDDGRLDQSRLAELDLWRRQAEIYDGLLKSVIEEHFKGSAVALDASSAIEFVEGQLRGRDTDVLDGDALMEKVRSAKEIFETQEQALRLVVDLVQGLASAEQAFDDAAAALPQGVDGKRRAGLEGIDLLEAGRHKIVAARDQASRAQFPVAIETAREAQVQAGAVQGLGQLLIEVSKQWARINQAAKSAGCTLGPGASGPSAIGVLAREAMAEGDFGSFESRVQEWSTQASRLSGAIEPLGDLVNRASELLGDAPAESVNRSGGAAQRATASGIEAFASRRPGERRDAIASVEEAISAFRRVVEGEEERRAAAAEAAAAARERYLGERSVTSTLGGANLTLIRCAAGTYWMGSPSSEPGRDDDEERRRESVGEFWVGETEVTQGQWEAVMGTRPWSGKSYTRNGSSDPATRVDWKDAMGFCRRLTERERAEGLPAGYAYRLPSQEEWEYACRAGTTTAYSFGSDADALGRYAVYGISLSASNAHAARVKSKQPNPWGLYDMHGNVWEWTSSLYDGGPKRVRRGGSWLNDALYCRSANRHWLAPGHSFDDLGFRVVLAASSGE